jgi:SAM-dependent methyltransferase
MDALPRSWNSLTEDRAAEYLKTYGAPSPGSKRLLVEVIREQLPRSAVSVLDLGCGNAQLYEYFRERELDCDYTGVDVSEPLLSVARENHRDDPRAHFLSADVNTLAGIEGRFDVAIYSHVLEIIGSPESSLLAAKALAGRIMIRFFEPPDAEHDLVELREMEIGDGSTVPYLRRTMGRDYYRLILAKLGCMQVDVYQDETAKDQVHVLHYD